MFDRELVRLSIVSNARSILRSIIRNPTHPPREFGEVPEDVRRGVRRGVRRSLSRESRSVEARRSHATKLRSTFENSDRHFS
ncbi:hypothetical protein CKA32_001843 [Geitlerinema sp. FC II]|nr:hypothetical protein CKA32_001843 [Geitlerinema sp. FC II]